MITPTKSVDPLMQPAFAEQRGELLIDRAVYLLQYQGITVSSQDAVDTLDSNGAILNRRGDLLFLRSRALRRMIGQLPQAFNIFDRFGSKIQSLVGGDDGRSNYILQAPCTVGAEWDEPTNLQAMDSPATQDSGADAFDLTAACASGQSQKSALGDLYGIYRGFLSASRPIVIRLSSSDSLDGLRGLLCGVTGSTQMLEGCPPIIVEAFSPELLHWDNEICRVIIDCARLGIPVALAAQLPKEMTNDPEQTAPGTMLTRATESVATSLTGLLIHQYALSRSPVMWAVPYFPSGGSNDWQLVWELIMSAGRELSLPIEATYPPLGDGRARFDYSGPLSAVAAASAGANLICWGGVSKTGGYDGERLCENANEAFMLRKLFCQMGRQSGQPAKSKALPEGEVKQLLRETIEREAIRWGAES